MQRWSCLRLTRRFPVERTNAALLGRAAFGCSPNTFAVESGPRSVRLSQSVQDLRSVAYLARAVALPRCMLRRRRSNAIVDGIDPIALSMAQPVSFCGPSPRAAASSAAARPGFSTWSGTALILGAASGSKASKFGIAKRRFLAGDPSGAGVASDNYNGRPRRGGQVVTRCLLEPGPALLSPLRYLVLTTSQACGQAGCHRE